MSQVEVPSRERIAKAALVALAAALVVLVTAVLPAEYGVDPLGSGRALGLLDLAEAENAAASTVPAPTAAAAVLTNTTQPLTYKVDSRDITLTPGEGIEIKYHMAKGASMVYSWKSTGKLFFEFHGEPDEKPDPDYYDSYLLDDQEGKEESHGSFIAPSTGISGWFWENPGEKDVKIHLTTAGFYDSAIQFSAAGPEELTVQDVK